VKEKTPTQRTKEHFEDAGYTVCLVEYVQRGGKRKDAFGFADLLGIHPSKKGTAYIQATTVDNMAARVEKIRGIPAALVALEAGNAIFVVGWKEIPIPGKKPEFVFRRRVIERADFAKAPPTDPVKARQ
jgi:hypothetical protein